MAGEVTQTSVILQSRLTQGDKLIDGDLPGHPGMACFEISESESFEKSFKTDWVMAISENDFIIKIKVTGLNPGTRYYYHLLYGENSKSYRKGRICGFRTWPEPNVEEEISFVEVRGMNYSKFHYGVNSTGKRAYTGSDKHLGYPGLETILNMNPDFFVGTGDNVYYDFPKETEAQTQAELRKKWYEQFIQSRFVTLFSQIPTYWEKDDHDHRFNDCDTTGTRPPSNRLCIRVFREQVPVVDPADPNAVTYRTHRINKLFQIWLVEGRDFRSHNFQPDGPDKSLWGKTQQEWLQNTLMASDATFKFLISPTPMIGPDDGYKNDNHTNPEGFRHEAESFFQWAKSQGFLKKNFYILCGDRH